MRTLFKRTVRTAVALELVDSAVQAMDGTKLAANAAMDRTYSEGKLRKILDRVDHAIGDLKAQNECGEDGLPARLPEQLASRKALRERVRQAMEQLPGRHRPSRTKRTNRINLTDRDARLMKTRQGIVPAFNAQAIISPLADSGYFAGSSLEECARRGQEVVVQKKRQSHLDDPYHKDRFVRNEATDTYTCPRGQTLHFFRMQFVNRVRNRVYRTSGATCRECPAFGVCTRRLALAAPWP